MVLLENILQKGLNLRQTEALAKQLEKAKPKRRKNAIHEELKVQLAQIEDNRSTVLGTKVRLFHDNKKGKIEIEYYGNEDLDRIVSIIREI